MDKKENRTSKFKEWWNDWHAIVKAGIIVGLIGILCLLSIIYLVLSYIR